MSKMFSVVTLASDSGLLEEYYAPGSPDCAEDLLEDEIIRDDLRSLPKSDRVYAEVGTYLYGEGETERASEEELAYFSKNFEELYASVQVDWIGGHSFGFGLRMCCQTIPMSWKQNWRTRTIWNYKLRQGKRGR